MKRKLASIQVIDKLEPIEYADNIEKAHILGWETVVKKGDYNVGHRCVFFEIDSLLPDCAWSKFMEKYNYRVKTCKIKGVLSQGLALAVDAFDYDTMKYFMKCEIGCDVTDYLGVNKYEQMIEERRASGKFPKYVPKTDELRLQSNLDLLDEIKESDFYYTTKYDGTSATFFNYENNQRICSRNLELDIYANNRYTRVAKKYNLDRLPNGYAVQGEVCGPKIQGNLLKLKEEDLFVFDVYVIDEKRYLNFDEFIDFCEIWDLKNVNVEGKIYSADINNFDFSLDNFLNLAKGVYPGTDVIKEGIVIRPMNERRSKALKGGRLSFKVINNDYLIDKAEKDSRSKKKAKGKIKNKKSQESKTYRVAVTSCKHCPMVVESACGFDPFCKMHNYYGEQPDIVDSVKLTLPPPDNCPLRKMPFNLTIHKRI
jgi:RNA ligase (TIGR02306 family)